MTFVDFLVTGPGICADIFSRQFIEYNISGVNFYQPSFFSLYNTLRNTLRLYLGILFDKTSKTDVSRSEFAGILKCEASPMISALAIVCQSDELLLSRPK